MTHAARGPHALDDVFRAEAEEDLARIGALLLALEAGDRDPSAVSELLRVAHSLKGAARMVDSPVLGDLMHALEGRMAAAREAGGALGSADFAWALAVHDEAEAALKSPSFGLRAPTAAQRALLAAAPSLADGASGPAPAEDAERAAAEAAIADLFEHPRPTPAPVRRAPDSVRVAVEKLDRVAGQVGELMGARLVSQRLLAGLRAMARDIEALRRGAETAGDRSACRGEWLALEKTAGALGRDAGRLDRALAVVGGALQEDLRRLRQRPFETILEGLPREVRDLAHQLGKDVGLVIVGAEVEVDRVVLDALGAPILHLVRNALDHGLETPAERAAAGKPARGEVRVEVQRMGGHVAVSVSDDGRGLDPARIAEVAVARGLLSAQEASTLTRAAIVRLIFEPGFSTARTVSAISGRGVGLDVVADAVAELGGTVEVRDAAGGRTTFELLVPIALATVKGLLVREGGATYVMPIEALDRVVVLDAQAIRRVAGRDVVGFDGLDVPIVRLEALLRADPPVPLVPVDGSPVLLALVGGGRRLAIKVDAALQELEVVVKPFGQPVRSIAGLAGAAVDAGGAVLPVLDVLDLGRLADRRHGEGDGSAGTVRVVLGAG